MLKEKIDYILEKYKDSSKTEITIDINEDLLELITEQSKEFGITISEYVEVALTMFLIEMEKEKFQDDYDNIIDIFDSYKLEKLIDSGKEYLVINPDGKHIMLLPIKVYEEMIRGMNGSLEKY